MAGGAMLPSLWLRFRATRNYRLGPPPFSESFFAVSALKWQLKPEGKPGRASRTHSVSNDRRTLLHPRMTALTLTSNALCPILEKKVKFINWPFKFEI